MTAHDLPTLTGIIVGLQFAAFGWRVHREINVGDQRRRTWMPLPDIVNVMALLAMVAFGIVGPLQSGAYGIASRVTVAAAATFIAFHPLTMAAHYGLPWRRTRPSKLVCSEDHQHSDEECSDYQYAPLEEVITLGVSALLAGLSAWWVAT